MEKVDKYLDRINSWKRESILLREICLDCGLEEDFKWMHPCYTYEGKNILLIHGFKDYCALLFLKGVLLSDPENILVQQTENVQSARQIRFTDIGQIYDLREVLKAYVFEAIEVEKAGLEVKTKKTSEYQTPLELESAFKEHDAFQTAFRKLTPGRQRGYLLFFAKAKLSKTRIARIEKMKAKIFDGKGYNEK